MKTLLLLLFIFLIACGSVEEEPHNKTTTMVDKAMEIFVFNKEILEDEVMFGTLCLALLKETGSKKNDMCDLYYHTQEQASEMSRIGLEMFEVLYDNEALSDEAVYFEVVDIIGRLTKIERMAKILRKDIAKVSGSGCVKCEI